MREVALMAVLRDGRADAADEDELAGADDDDDEEEEEEAGRGGNGATAGKGNAGAAAADARDDVAVVRGLGLVDAGGAWG